MKVGYMWNMEQERCNRWESKGFAVPLRKLQVEQIIK